MGIEQDNWTKEFKKVEFYDGFPDWMIGMMALLAIYFVYCFIVSPFSILFLGLIILSSFGIGKIAKKIISKVLTTNT